MHIACVSGHVCVWVGKFMCECGCGSAVCAVLYSARLWNCTCTAYIAYSDTRQISSCTHTAKQKHLHTHFPHLSVLPCSALFPVVSHLPSWSIHRQTGKCTHTRTHTGDKFQWSSEQFSSMCAQTVWHLVCALGDSAHPFPPSKEACHWASSLPQVGSLELTCYLSPSCVWSFPLTAQGAPSVESRTHTTNTHASLARRWNRTGGWAGDTSPESQWCPSFFPAAYFSPLTHTSRQLPSSTNSDPCWQADRLLSRLVWGSIAANILFWFMRLIYCNWIY